MKYTHEFSPATPPFPYVVDVVLDPAVKGNTATAIISPKKAYWLVIEGLMAFSSTGGRWLTVPSDSMGVRYANAAIENACLYGGRDAAGQIRPYWFPQKLVLSPATDLLLDLTGIGAIQSVQIVALCSKHTDMVRPPKTGLIMADVEVPNDPRNPKAGTHTEKQPMSDFRTIPYWLVTNYAMVTAGDTDSDVGTAPDGHPLFLVHQMAREANTANGGFKASFEQSELAQWDNGFINRDNGFGSAQGPFPLSKARYMKGGYTMTGTVRDLSLAINQSVQIVHGGYRRYYTGPDA